MQMIAYNMAKSSVNYAAGRIHREEDRIIVIPVQPGWIATDMGSRAAVMAGSEYIARRHSIDHSFTDITLCYTSEPK